MSRISRKNKIEKKIYWSLFVLKNAEKTHASYFLAVSCQGINSSILSHFQTCKEASQKVHNMFLDIVTVLTVLLMVVQPSTQIVSKYVFSKFRQSLKKCSWTGFNFRCTEFKRIVAEAEQSFKNDQAKSTILQNQGEIFKMK